MSDPDSSAPPDRIPKNGKAPLVLVLASLAIAALGLALWLGRGRGEGGWATHGQPTPIAAAALAPAPPRAPSEPLPPPPPQIAPTASAAPPAPAAPGPCEGECSGDATPELTAALRARASQARSCYERALAEDATLAGTLSVSARISPAGASCRASVDEDTLGQASVARCVVQRFQGGTYPAPKGGCVDVAVPIHFVPRQ